MRRTHNMSESRLYNIWILMRKRCANSNVESYKYYGGRGISVCSEWQQSFESFYTWSMRNGYLEELSID